METQTKFLDLVPDLNAGIFEIQLEAAVREVITGVVATDKGGEFTIKCKVKPIKGSQQLRLEHQLRYTRPTKNGSQATEETTDTVVFATVRGDLSITPFNQLPLFEDSKR